MIIDLRSDTLTKPTPAMREAMFTAEVGDDVFGEDPNVNALEEEVADLLGHEAALYCASGTMCNQIAILAHTRPGDQLICYENAHVYLYEGGGAAANAGVTARRLSGKRGVLSPEDLAPHVNVDDPHFPNTRLVCIENTVNKGGGACWELSDVQSVSGFCKEHGLALHLDGARLFNAVVAKGYSAKEFTSEVDSVSICLSKGLGAPVGSVLAGPKDFIHQARRIRKRFGGGMRQAGILAAAGRYALRNHVDRLVEDHRRAKTLAEVLDALPWVDDVVPVETNIVIFHPKAPASEVLKDLESVGIRAVPFGPTAIRLVVHLDISEEMIEAFTEKVKSLYLSRLILV